MTHLRRVVLRYDIGVLLTVMGGILFWVYLYTWWYGLILSQQSGPPAECSISIIFCLEFGFEAMYCPPLLIDLREYLGMESWVELEPELE